MKLRGQQLIGYTSLARGHETFRAVNPRSSDSLEPAFFEATREEVDHAMNTASCAFAVYRKTIGSQRATFLEVIADRIMDLGDALLDRFTEETALPRGRAEGERARTVGQLRMFADLVREGSWVEARIDTALPDRISAAKPDLRRMLIPVGPVVVFSASNFPLAFSVAGGDTASALAAGCPVVVKAHEAHPGVSEMVSAAIQAAAIATHMPDGVFSMLQGANHAIGMALVTHPATQAVGFTGSLRGGRALFDAATSRAVPIPVYAEMGSVNPVVILPDAAEQRAEMIAEGLVESLTLGVGQFCTNPGLVVGIQNAAFDRLIQRAAERVDQVNPASMLHRGLCQAYHEGVKQMRYHGARVVGQSSQPPNFERTEVRPTLIKIDGDSFLKHPSLKDEVFGPSTLFVAVRDQTELARVIESLDGQLTATLHATEQAFQDHRQLIELLETRVGRLIFDGFPTGVEVCASMHHGGPYPATSDVRSTSVGSAAICRFARPICYQGFPQNALPLALRDRNQTQIWRMIDNEMTREDVGSGEQKS